MTEQKLPIQDRRSVSRLESLLDCRFSFEGTEHKAFIRDLSLKSAFLLSTFMPPHGVIISIKLETPALTGPLILEGKIVRRDCSHTDRGTTGAFVVTFSHSSPEFIRLVSKLSFSGTGR